MAFRACSAVLYHTAQYALPIMCGTKMHACDLLVSMLLQRRGVLRPSQNLQRVTFTEVTQKAVKEALQHPRQVCWY
jgi:hypothetical protein